MTLPQLRLNLSNMIGAIAGDIIGSIYEAHPIETKVFPLFGSDCRFTDDTVLTAAVAEVILDRGTYSDRFRHYYRPELQARTPGSRWPPQGKPVPGSFTILMIGK